MKLKINDKRGKIRLVIAGSIIALSAILLSYFGNPKNMGFCIACFIRDTTGALSLHSSSNVQYVRPEIIGLVLGSFFISLLKGEFKPRGGSSPLLRFIIGTIVMIGALTFLGCPLRMVLRLSAGDLNALVGLIGFVLGIGVGCVFLSKGFSLGKSKDQSKSEGVAFPFLLLVLLITFLLFPSLFKSSTSGPGSMRAPILLSLVLSLLSGVFAQRSRICMAGSIRDVFLLKDTTLLFGSLSIFLVALIGNLITGNFKFGFALQPVSHSAFLWNILSMFTVGLGSVMLGGCPLRQLVLSGEGSSDSAITVLGFVFGAALSHNFSLFSSPDTLVDGVLKVGGPGKVGKIVLPILIVILLAIAFINTYVNRKKEKA